MPYNENIRVKIDHKYSALYNDLRNFALGDSHELFFLCACLGYNAKSCKPIEKSEDKFWSRTFTPEEYSCFYAMILEENNMDLSHIKEDAEVIKKVEQYANSGIEILIEELLCDYVIKGEEPHLDSSMKEDVPKILLSYLFEKSKVKI